MILGNSGTLMVYGKNKNLISLKEEKTGDVHDILGVIVMIFAKFFIVVKGVGAVTSIA